MRLRKASQRMKSELLVEELFEVEEFLILFSKNLLKNISPELALCLSVQQYSGNLKGIFSNSVAGIYFENRPLKEAASTVINSLSNPQSKRLFNYMMGLIEYDPHRRAETALKTLYRLKENQQLYYKRQNIVKSQSFKIKFLVNVISIVLGLVCSLSPWFSIASVLLNNNQLFNLKDLQISLNPATYVLTSFIMICLTNSYILFSIIKLDNKLFFTTISIVLFLATYFLGTLLLSSILRSWV